MRTSRSIRLASILASALSIAVAAVGLATAGASAAGGSACSRLAAQVAHNGTASAPVGAKRRGALHRCMARYRRTTYRHRKQQLQEPAPVPEPAPTPAGDTTAPTPEPTPAPTPSSSGMIVGLDAGNYGTAGAADVRGAVNTVRYDTELGVTGLENFKKAGLRIQMNFSGPYNSGGVCGLNASAWVSATLAFYKANVTPTQAPAIEVLNEPGGSWFWGSGAESAANAVCYRNLLMKTHEAFHAQYGESAPKILGTLDGPNGLTFGKAWYTSDWATYVDGFIVHPYGGTGSRTSSALGSRALVESARAITGGPIYITEVGWPTATGQPSTGDSLQWTESEQATNITNFIAWAHGTGYVAEVDYFNYRDYGTNAWYGIARSDGSHKPAYEALRQAASKYGA